jgi:hypothetical protein
VRVRVRLKGVFDLLGEGGDLGPKYTERAIYNEARQRGLINDGLKDEITDLYQWRNATTHRFFLTDLTYADLGPLLDRYEMIFGRCMNIVEELEMRQVREGKGMTVRGPAANRIEVLQATNAKLGFDPKGMDLR